MYCYICGEENEDLASNCKKCGAELRKQSSLQTDLSKYVGFWRRLGARFIDGLILSVVNLIIGFILGILLVISMGEYNYNNYSDLFTLFSYAVGIVIVMLYYVFLESSSRQATFGKQAMGIMVTDLEGNRISFGKAILRHIIKIVTGLILGIGYIAIIFTEKKQGLYDMAVGTVVVYK